LLQFHVELELFLIFPSQIFVEKFMQLWRDRFRAIFKIFSPRSFHVEEFNFNSYLNHHLSSSLDQKLVNI
jgi:hypothetical protein